ncbi:MAG: trimethylamine methyltransferase family protein [Thermoleophilia bacterium]|nr:trimethylamine methyltransferase family protein [Thermoleophilia bacterium]
MSRRQLFGLLTPGDVEFMLDKALQFLDEKGVIVEHEGLRRTLASAGARVDAATEIVRFPTPLVEECLARVPETFVLAGRDPEDDLVLPHPTDGFYFRTNTGATRYLDPATREMRPVTLDDIRSWGRLVDRLENVSFAAFGSPVDAPSETADVHALRALLEGTRKHVWVQPYSEGSLRYLAELVVAAAGGGDQLRCRPRASFIVNALTPFQFKSVDAEAMIKACELGLPVHACSLPSAGGTAPVTDIGTCFVMGVEILAILVMSQVLSPGHPVVGAPIAFAMDMMTGGVGQSSPESIRSAAAAVQFVASAFGVPTHTYGTGSDSPVFDGQVLMEGCVLGSAVASAGADILGGGGQFEAASSISPLKLIADDEMAAMLNRLVQGSVVNEENLAWQMLLDIPHGGTYLDADHTFLHCRDAWRPRLFVRQSQDVWLSRGAKNFQARLEERYEELMSEPAARPLPPGASAQLEEVVRYADAHLVAD